MLLDWEILANSRSASDQGRRVGKQQQIVVGGKLSSPGEEGEVRNAASLAAMAWATAIGTSSGASAPALRTALKAAAGFVGAAMEERGKVPQPDVARVGPESRLRRRYGVGGSPRPA
ncbi:MAG TPA: hypothetical protein VGB04_04345 [Allosphingosinicella sp.]|jgi:hypothetical protein